MRELTVAMSAAMWIACCSASWADPPAAASAMGAPPPAGVAQLMRENLVSDPGKEVVMLTVTYAPGGSSPPHRHDAQVFVYVLEGTLRMQVQGRAAVTLQSGDTFYEAPGDVHAVSANGSDTVPAKFLVVMVKDKRRPASSPAAH